MDENIMELEELAKHLEKYKVGTTDTNSEEYFSAVVKIAIDEYKWPITKLTHRFSVPKQTVGRWKNGKSAPHKVLRPFVLEWIIKNL